jgi:hypothetical protein
MITYHLQWFSSAIGWYDVRELASKQQANDVRRHIRRDAGQRVVERRS